MSRKGRYWYLYLNPSGEPVQCADISGLSRPARSVACACWPVRGYHSNVLFRGQGCSDGTTGIPHHPRKTVTKRTKVQCILSYLSTTSMGITGIEDKKKRPRQNITVWDCRPVVTLLSRLLWHALRSQCYYSLGPGNTQALCIDKKRAPFNSVIYSELVLIPCTNAD
jgi:hypothetical protein